MELRSIFSSAPARGWLPWGLLAPVIALALSIASEIPSSLLLARWGFLDAQWEPVGTQGLIAFLLISFSAMGVAFLAWVMLVERRPLETIGLSRSGGVRSFLGGHLIGLVTISAIVAGIWIAGGYRASDIGAAFGAPGAMASIVILLGSFAVQASVEEVVFRGWLLSVMTRRLNLIVAVLLSSALFTLMHFSVGQPLIVIANIALFSIFACCWAILANNIWGVMGWHAGWNWLLATGFETPVTGLNTQTPALLVRLTPQGSDLLTGGPQGPEGSIVCTLFFAASTVVLLVRIRRRLAAGTDRS